MFVKDKTLGDRKIHITTVIGGFGNTVYRIKGFNKGVYIFREDYPTLEKAEFRGDVFLGLKKPKKPRRGDEPLSAFLSACEDYAAQLFPERTVVCDIVFKDGSENTEYFRCATVPVQFKDKETGLWEYPKNTSKFEDFLGGVHTFKGLRDWYTNWLAEKECGVSSIKWRIVLGDGSNG